MNKKINGIETPFIETYGEPVKRIRARLPSTTWRKLQTGVEFDGVTCKKCLQYVMPIQPANQCPECWSDLSEWEPTLSDILIGAALAGVIAWAVIYETIKYLEEAKLIN